jgi:hypothetical protein
LLLLHVVVDGTVCLHLLDVFHPGDGPLDGIEIGEGAAEPTFGDIMLAASLGGFLDRFLGLFLGANKEDLAAFASGGAKELASCIQLRESLAQVDDVNAVTGVEDELFHLRIPAAGLMSEMDT